MMQVMLQQPGGKRFLVQDHLGRYRILDLEAGYLWPPVRSVESVLARGYWYHPPAGIDVERLLEQVIDVEALEAGLHGPHDEQHNPALAPLHDGRIRSLRRS